MNYPSHIINCGNDADAHLAYIAMFRYAFGRATYMPTTIIAIIKRNKSRLTMRTLAQLDCELTEEEGRYEYAYKGKPTSNYGMDCDRKAWLEFHEWVKAQIKEREAKGGASC